MSEKQNLLLANRYEERKRKQAEEEAEAKRIASKNSEKNLPSLIKEFPTTEAYLVAQKEWVAQTLLESLKTKDGRLVSLDELIAGPTKEFISVLNDRLLEYFEEGFVNKSKEAREAYTIILREVCRQVVQRGNELVNRGNSISQPALNEEDLSNKLLQRIRQVAIKRAWQKLRPA